MALLKFCTVILLITKFSYGEVKNKGWWKNSVFYQVYPQSFMDSNKDGIGDLKGITSKLEHFVESGIDGIWMNPIFVSPMIDFGYDISNYRDIDPIFGSLNDLQELIREAKKLGIKIILDFVPNHTSDKHEWFIKSVNGEDKYKDYYIWREGKENNTKPPNDWLSDFEGSAWEYNEKRNLWYLHQYDKRQPDLNFSNPNVFKEMEDILKYWLEMGIDGFRMDAANFFMKDTRFLDEPLSDISEPLPDEFLYRDHIYTMTLNESYEIVNKFKKAIDDWSDLRNEDEKIFLTEAFETSDQPSKHYNHGAQIPFNFQLITDIYDTSRPSDYKRVIERWIDNAPKDSIPNWVIGNHDYPRVDSRLQGRGDQMIMLSMLLPGIQITYYGEEIGMVDNYDIPFELVEPRVQKLGRDRYKTSWREPQRTPFQWDNSTNAGFSDASKTWLPVNANYKDLNLMKQKSRCQSHYKLYQYLTRLRRSSEALKNGKTEVKVLNNNEVLAVIRKSLKENIVLLINFSDNSTQEVNLTEDLNGVPEATLALANINSGSQWGSSVKTSCVQLPPKGSLMLVAKNPRKFIIQQKWLRYIEMACKNPPFWLMVS